MSPIDYRFCTVADARQLAAMNKVLIRDEAQRNPMTLDQLEARMAGWLCETYRAVIFERDGEALGYSLYRIEPDHVYLRQFFIARAFRRQGIGRAAIGWLTEHAWHSAKRIRLDVLVGNTAGIEFWRSVGFADYCITMERDM